MEKQSPLTVVFCVPGAPLSGSFLEFWNRLSAYCFENEIVPILSLGDSPLCPVARARRQKPFAGHIHYDYLCWMDQDIICRPERFHTLLSQGADIMSALIWREGGRSFAAARDGANDEGQPPFLTPDDLVPPFLPIEVAYTDIKFTVVKREVMEALAHPWFKSVAINSSSLVHICPDSAEFCRQVRKLGFKVFVDPTIRLSLLTTILPK